MNTIQRRAAARGFTLVELMVSLAIGLFIALAAATLYVTTQDTARVTRSFSETNETGKLALDMLGRELEKAGFYPAEFESGVSGAAVSEQQLGQYTNIKTTGSLAKYYDQGLYGCTGANFNFATTNCPTPSATPDTPDSIVINYFNSVEFGAAAVIGNTNDCNRDPVQNDAANTARAAAGLPLLVSNRFALVSQNMVQPDGSVVVTHYLGCHGNGNETATTYKPLLQGIDDMVLMYGVYSGVTQSPARFYSAKDMAVTDWPKVTAVRVCLIVRSFENARLPDKTGNVRLKPNCRGRDTDVLPSNNRYIYKRFEQVFAIRNYLSGLL
jgi:type IV pilus assembly protein PilW